MFEFTDAFENACDVRDAAQAVAEAALDAFEAAGDRSDAALDAFIEARRIHGITFASAEATHLDRRAAARALWSARDELRAAFAAEQAAYEAEAEAAEALDAAEEEVEMYREGYDAESLAEYYAYIRQVRCDYAAATGF